MAKTENNLDIAKILTTDIEKKQQPHISKREKKRWKVEMCALPQDRTVNDAVIYSGKFGW